MTRPELANALKVPVSTLNTWASRGTGPAYVIVGKHSRYRWSDVEAWLEEQTVSRAGEGS
jgi:excisionase family DNA binding protein